MKERIYFDPNGIYACLFHSFDQEILDDIRRSNKLISHKIIQLSENHVDEFFIRKRYDEHWHQKKKERINHSVSCFVMQSCTDRKKKEVKSGVNNEKMNHRVFLTI